jgi:hypothetical protein
MSVTGYGFFTWYYEKYAKACLLKRFALLACDNRHVRVQQRNTEDLRFSQ